VATLLHEINSPLTGIINYVLLLLDENLPGNAPAILLEMLDACRRIERVMHSMEHLEELRGRPGPARHSLLDLNS
jgi:signal transduction histidine kinase